MLNNKMSEYNALCEEIESLESQMPSMEEMVLSDDATEKYRKIKGQVNEIQGRRGILKEWLSGYMAACADMHNTKVEDEISALLGE